MIDYRDIILNSFPLGQKIVNVTNKQLFFTISSAADFYNIPQTDIRQAAYDYAKGKNRYCKNCRWLKYTDYIKINHLTDLEAIDSLFLIT